METREQPCVPCIDIRVRTHRSSVFRVEQDRTSQLIFGTR